jgi:hypothetical protein
MNAENTRGRSDLFFTLGPQFPPALTVLLSLLVSDLPLAMPSEVQIFSKWQPALSLADLCLLSIVFFFIRPPCQNRSFIQWHLPVRFNLLHTHRFAMLTAPCHRWEFFTTLDFEWEIFTGRRPWRWSFIVYLTARLLALMATVCDLVGFNLTSMYDCNVSIRSGIPFV